MFLQIERTLGAMTDRVIAVGDAQKADIANYGVAPLNKILTIPLGLEIEPMLDAEQHRGRLRAELGVDADRQLIGIVARLVPDQSPRSVPRSGRRYPGRSAATHVPYHRRR